MERWIDDLARTLAGGMSRRAALHHLGGAILGVAAGGILPGRARADQGGPRDRDISACARFCQAVFRGSAAGQCTAEAARDRDGSGMCASCGGDPAQVCGSPTNRFCCNRGRGERCCDAGCVDVRTDANNCGDCGVTCNGACQNGACQRCGGLDQDCCAGFSCAPRLICEVFDLRTASCRPCGDSNQRCCSGLSCAPGLTCQRPGRDPATCKRCGSRDQPCCDGSTGVSCAPGLTCDFASSTCQPCGGRDQACCTTGPACSAGLGCDVLAVTCRPCGLPLQPCCAVGPACSQPGLFCVVDEGTCQ